MSPLTATAQTRSHAEGPRVPPERAGQALLLPGSRKLTLRDRDLLCPLALGLPTADIADLVHLSEDTIKTRLRTLYRTMSVSGRVQGAAGVVASGLLCPELAALLRELPVPELTGRERELLAMIVRGDGDQDIAKQLNLSLDGAKLHLASLRTRTGTSNRTRLAAHAALRRLVEPGDITVLWHERRWPANRLFIEESRDGTHRCPPLPDHYRQLVSPHRPEENERLDSGRTR